MQLIVDVASVMRHAGRQAEYRRRQGEEGRKKDATRKRKTREAELPQFIGVDSEGIGRGYRHRSVLLGVGSEQYLASDMDRGLQWEEVFQFLYDQKRKHPRAAFVGFYLGYDFNQWLKSLPLKAAWLLLSIEGRASRKVNGKSKTYRRRRHPVRIGGWEVEMLAFKRLSIRPRPEGCVCFETKPYVKCTHKYEPWMHVCDAGSFFQMSFLKVIDPEMWKDDKGMGPVCTQKEYERIKRNKEKRAYFSRVTKEMCHYNVLENELFAKCMTRLALGFRGMGIGLANDQWYGPGASAGKWLGQHEAPRKEELEGGIIPEWAWEAYHKSYFAGWFEIFSHGLIGGSSWIYDLNNAYPYATTKLPHICKEGRFERGEGEYNGNSPFVLLYTTVFGRSTRIGPVPYRNKDGNILRPGVSKGWYWSHEIDAARRAGLVKRVMTREWIAYEPCGHDRPFEEVEELYEKRLEVGKYSAQGMAIKLTNNSLYGKFAQSVGGAPFNNWFYASYITSVCRTQILEAIGSHPGGADSTLMVATDGVAFDSRHPGLAVSKKLGEWDEQELKELVLFKPGVWWHKQGKENLVKIKSRGVPREAFKQIVKSAEAAFMLWHYDQSVAGATLEAYRLEAEGTEAEFTIDSMWPVYGVPVGFRMKTCRQALNEGKWETAAEVQEKILLMQDSNPHIKRRRATWNGDKQRCDTYVHDLGIKEIETYYHGNVVAADDPDIGFAFTGEGAEWVVEELVQAVKDRYDEDKWERVH